MAKWSEKHMYNWVAWMRSLNALHDKINEWTVTPVSLPKFFVFVLNTTLGSVLLGFIVGLMAIPQTIEWVMRNIIDGVEKLGKGRSVGIKHTIREFTYVMLAIFVLIPYAITWGLPKLIMEHRENKRLERLQELRQHQRVTNEDRRRWDDVNDRIIFARGRIEVKEDFKPKLKLKSHNMVEPRTISTGNYSIAIGYGNTARGNHSISPWPSDVTITTHTEGGVTTAMVTHNNINNEGYRLQ